MLENGERRGAAPECREELGWIYQGGRCYMITSFAYTDDIDAQRDNCAEIGATLLESYTWAYEEPFCNDVIAVIGGNVETSYVCVKNA